MKLDLSTWTRLREVQEYAVKRDIGIKDAIRELVNHALSTPDPQPGDWEDKVEAGAVALMSAYPFLLEDFTPDFFRKMAERVLEAGL